MSTAPSPSAGPLVSVIVCSRDAPGRVAHRDHVAGTIGCPHEYVRIDNHDGRFGICAAYNLGVTRALAPILAFVHEDVRFRRNDWGLALIERFATRPDVGLVGVAGYERLELGMLPWPRKHHQYLRGAMVCASPGDGGEVMSVFGDSEGDAEVAVVDGLFFAIRAELFPTIAFDEGLFRGFHLYDFDISMQVAQSHRLLVTADILVRHHSRSSYGPGWRADAAFFVRKWQAHLPASAEQVPRGPRVSPR